MQQSNERGQKIYLTVHKNEVKMEQIYSFCFSTEWKCNFYFLKQKLPSLILNITFLLLMLFMYFNLYFYATVDSTS